jgi:hypothetical protein
MDPSCGSILAPNDDEYGDEMPCPQKATAGAIAPAVVTFQTQHSASFVNAASAAIPAYP